MRLVLRGPSSLALPCFSSSCASVPRSFDRPSRASGALRLLGSVAVRRATALSLLAALAFAAPADAQSPPPTESAPAPAAATPSIWDAPEPWRTDRFYLETSVYTKHFNS